MMPTLSTFPNLDGAGLGEEDPMASYIVQFNISRPVLWSWTHLIRMRLIQ